jgi:hypothetical protein
MGDFILEFKKTTRNAAHEKSPRSCVIKLIGLTKDQEKMRFSVPTHMTPTLPQVHATFIEYIFYTSMNYTVCQPFYTTLPMDRKFILQLQICEFSFYIKKQNFMYLKFNPLDQRFCG